jgi:hypothetical protein
MPNSDECNCKNCNCDNETYVGSAEEAGRDKEFEKKVAKKREENRKKSEAEKGWFSDVNDRTKDSEDSYKDE